MQKMYFDLKTKSTKTKRAKIKKHLKNKNQIKKKHSTKQNHALPL